MALTREQIIEMSTEVIELLQNQIADLPEDDVIDYLNAIARAFATGLRKEDS